MLNREPQKYTHSFEEEGHCTTVNYCSIVRVTTFSWFAEEFADLAPNPTIPGKSGWMVAVLRPKTESMNYYIN
jgi:hypothetical protein